MDTSLEDLGLGPRATLLVEPLAASTQGGARSVAGQAGGRGAGLFGALRSAVGSLAAYANPWSYWGQAAPMTVGEAPCQAELATGGNGGADEHVFDAQDGAGSSARRRGVAGGSGSNVHSLADTQGTKRGREAEGNAYWNGNSTQFDGGDGKDA